MPLRFSTRNHLWSVDSGKASLMCRCSCPRSIRADVIDYREVKPSPSCWICGGDPDALLRAFKLGAQAVAFDTYADNLAATAAREAAERQRQTVIRWSE